MQESLKSSIAAPLFNFGRSGYFTSVAGYTNARYVPCTDVARHIYKKIFAVFDEFNLRYFVFAGALVGYVRNGNLPPWLDDMDVMVFEDDILLFENKVAPRLIEMGFNCRRPAKSFCAGGFHILSLQQSGNRNDTIPFSADLDVSVPWVQVDVFFSKVDESGFVKNLAGWGLYHRRKVKYDWFIEPRRIKMDGIEFPTISEIKDSVSEEYGDVCSELIVKTHGTTFLSAAYMEWPIFQAEFERLVGELISFQVPGVTLEQFEKYIPIQGCSLKTDSNASFEDICLEVVLKNAQALTICGGGQIFWVMDLKRVFPELEISVLVSNSREVARAAHLSDFIDEFIFATPDLHESLKNMLSYFGRVI